MVFPVFKPYPLELIAPSFDSGITDLVIDLDHLRRKEMMTVTHPLVFSQLIELFHLIEGIASARIEGNNTHILEIFQADQELHSPVTEGVKEIRNLENTLAYIDENLGNRKIDISFIREIHKRIMIGLKSPPLGDGDPRSGLYRQEEVGIAGSSHLPPPPWEIDSLMNELLAFLDQDHSPKYDLIKSAIFHHRFVWIHPFTNGNGRTVRMLHYALLIKQGFKIDRQRILNPASAFCLDRSQYYRSLAKADTGEKNGILEWCYYLLNGLKAEIEKVDRLSDTHYLNSKILIPAIDISYQRNLLTEKEVKLLKITAEKQQVQAADFKEIFKNKLPQEISRQIRKIRKSTLLIPEFAGARKYVINLDSDLLRNGILTALDQEGFLP
jgi:Fic family protein